MIPSRRVAAILGLAVPLALPLALPSALLTMSARPARASGDECLPRWRIDTASLGDCDTIAALSPGNDTRANLLLLLLDRHGLPPDPPAAEAKPVLSWRDFRDGFASGVPSAGPSAAITYAAGEGSRCRSDGGGLAGFVAAVAAATALPPDERAALLAARGALKPDCATATVPAIPAPTPTAPGPAAAAAAVVRSDLGRAFAAYLAGAEAFYAARFDEAESAFARAKGGADPWLADAAAYMLARTAVNRLQAGAFDDYGAMKEGFAADPAAASRAEADLDAYIRDHPDGRYAPSARGLLRRVDWLAGRTEKLAGRYSALLAQPANARGTDDLSLVEEIDAKLLPQLTPAMTRDPLLLAVMDLKALRRGVGKPEAPPARPDLDGQRDAFAGLPALHEFLLASAGFAVDGAPAPVLKAMPDDTRRRDGDYLWFSRQLLRGQALEAAGDRNAPGFWRELAAGAARPLTRSLVELALALHGEAHERLDDLFAPGSIVTDPEMRRILLQNDAGPALLRARARDAAAPADERQATLATLLHKELTRGFFADFLDDLAAVTADAPPSVGVFARGPIGGDIGCPKLAAVAAALAADPEAVRGRLCLAEFVRVNGLYGDVDTVPAKGDLGGGPTAFPGRPSTRSATYAAVIADRGASADERAYALFRAVRCYQPAGHTECGGDDVPKATRRGWYEALKRDYPASRWAKRSSLWW